MRSVEPVEIRLLALTIAVFVAPFVYFSLLFWLGLAQPKKVIPEHKIRTVNLVASLGFALVALLGVLAHLRAG